MKKKSAATIKIPGVKKPVPIWLAAVAGGGVLAAVFAMRSSPDVDGDTRLDSSGLLLDQINQMLETEREIMSGSLADMDARLADLLNSGSDPAPGGYPSYDAVRSYAPESVAFVPAGQPFAVVPVQTETTEAAAIAQREPFRTLGQRLTAQAETMLGIRRSQTPATVVDQAPASMVAAAEPVIHRGTQTWGQRLTAQATAMRSAAVTTGKKIPGLAGSRIPASSSTRPSVHRRSTTRTITTHKTDRLSQTHKKTTPTTPRLSTFERTRSRLVQ